MKRLNVIVDLNDQVFSGCIKFVADVLGDDNFTIHDQYSWKNYVEDAAKNNLKDAQEEYVVGACTSESPSQFATNKNAFDAVQMCRLPAIFDDIANNPPVCYAGLCTVVRKMVHHHAFNGKKQSTSLLGYQETCLKAYAEVSSWTSFCENDFPNAIKMYPAHQSFESGCDNKAPIAIPYVMLKLEKELQTPKNLPNKSKYLGKDKEKWLTKLVSESFEGQKLQQSLQQYIREFKQKLDECRCWSPYLNGFQLTIADLIILHMVFQLLSKLADQGCLCQLKEMLPMIFEWIEMVKAVLSRHVFIQDKISGLFCSKNQNSNGDNSLSCTSWSGFPDGIDPVSQTKLEQRNKKIKVDHQGHISVTLEKMDKCGFGTHILNLTDCPPSIDWQVHSDYLNPAQGDLNLPRAVRKQQQIANILHAITPLVKPGSRIVDFCAGGGHVGIVLAYFFPESEVVLVENKEESVLRAVKRIKELKLENIRICHTNLDYFCGPFDVGVTLHACGIATDLVLNMCYKERASFVVCPCCYGSINSIESISYPRSKQFCKNISIEDYMVLSHSSDMTTWDEKSEKCRSGRLSMALIDLDRCNFMNELGYKTQLRAMIPNSCSPKNHVIIGTFNPVQGCV